MENTTWTQFHKSPLKSYGGMEVRSKAEMGVVAHAVHVRCASFGSKRKVSSSTVNKPKITPSNFVNSNAETSRQTHGNKVLYQLVIR